MLVERAYFGEQFSSAIGSHAVIEG
jgi:hypothetical protein